MKQIFLKSNYKNELGNGVELLLGHYMYTLTDNEETADLTVEAKHWECKQLLVSKFGNKCEISYCDKVHFFRGLISLIQNVGQENYKCSEKVNMDSCGIMVDCSRNGVPTINSIKEYIMHLAKFGMNRLYLYIEDTLEIVGYPYWGYLRGRYTKEEIKDCVAFGDMFGVVLIPCIQTLAHLRTVLRHPEFAEYKDIDDILLVGEEKTKKLLCTLLDSISGCFSSGMVHLGMDEAAHLGRGKYLDKHGWKIPSSIMKEHLVWLNEECEKRNLTPIIWSDMYLSLNFNVKDYYGISEKAVPLRTEDLSEKMCLCYWDYYNEGKEFYQKYIRIHRKLGNPLIFAGGAWTWNGIAPNYGRAVKTTVDALDACIEEQVKDVFCTAWMDNGSETPMMTLLPILALYGEYCFGERPTRSRVEEKTKFCLGKEWKDYFLLDTFDNEEYFQYKLDEEWTSVYHNKYSKNISKAILYQDCLMSMFEKMHNENELKRQYIYLKEQLDKILQKELSAEDRSLFQYYQILAELLSEKAGIGEAIRQAYRMNDFQKLEDLQNRLQMIAELAEKLRLQREEIWMSEYKPFGYEVIDIRLGGVKTRTKSAKKRISDYLAGKCTNIAELEAEILPYQITDNPQTQQGNYFWEKIVSAGNIEGI